MTLEQAKLQAAQCGFAQSRKDERLFESESGSLLFYNGNGLVNVVENKERIGLVLNRNNIVYPKNFGEVKKQRDGK